MKAKICLSVLTRRFCNKTVDVPDDFESWDENRKDTFIGNVFIETVDNGYDNHWQDDNDWGCEEGEHQILQIIK